MLKKERFPPQKTKGRSGGFTAELMDFLDFFRSELSQTGSFWRPVAAASGPCTDHRMVYGDLMGTSMSPTSGTNSLKHTAVGNEHATKYAVFVFGSIQIDPVATCCNSICKRIWARVKA